MALQYALTHRTNAMSQLYTDIGINAVIKLFTGVPPTNCGTADTGTTLVTFAGNATAFGTAASQVLTASAVANANAAAAGTAGYFRIYPSAATTTNAVAQGLCGANVVIATSALSAANSNVLTFTATTGVAVGQTVSGVGVVAGSTVVAFTATTVTLSLTSTAGVASAASITFSYDMVLTNTNIAASQTCAFSSLTVTAFGV